MTLIVARTLANCVWIVGDTFITGGASELRRPDLGLKLLAFDPKTIIGFAGSPEIAHAVLTKVSHEERGKPGGLIAEKLRDYSGTQGLDFIVAQGGRLTTIKSGRIEVDVPHAWIGDHQGFEAFQTCHDKLQNASPTVFFRPEGNDEPQGASNLEIVNVESMCGYNGDTRSSFLLLDALQQVIEDKSTWRVGGPAVVAICGENEARYLSFSRASSPTQPIHLLNEWVPVDFGNAASGGCCATTITPAAPGICGWGMFYHQAFVGCYFSANLPAGRFDLYKGRANNAAQFCEALAEVGLACISCGSFG